MMLAQEQQQFQQPPMQPPQDQISQNPKKTRQRKKNSQQRHNDAVRTLPSGAPVNFGHGSSNKKNKERLTVSPSLPDGSKPNFQPSKSSKTTSSSSSLTSSKSSSSSSSRKNNKNDEYSLPDGRKPNFYNDKSYSSFKNHFNNPNTKAIREKKVDDNTYAGSSFHSSPDALQLPKPSFKMGNGSPRQPVVLREPRAEPGSSNGFFD
ncbi:Enhancer of mRNA-decapping protein 1 [Candida viswanathii]|uniref:Enhancer of mRNA-decapping protein 1 n=1 Tax=Candida viswanathii TaxID=5486 RepID=A0A367XLV0_9ASCO|nr:Enhancer of mRNA-decapping protein 1 [Candida viswanathii]RCK54615.1 Enhancer of mRNA-decapping protein 1 [Candida viswanathii]